MKRLAMNILISLPWVEADDQISRIRRYLGAFASVWKLTGGDNHAEIG